MTTNGQTAHPKGARVLVVSLNQRGLVRANRRGRVQVLFGLDRGKEFLAWFPAADVVPLGP